MRSTSVNEAGRLMERAHDRAVRRQDRSEQRSVGRGAHLRAARVARQRRARFSAEVALETLRDLLVSRPDSGNVYVVRWTREHRVAVNIVRDREAGA